MSVQHGFDVDHASYPLKEFSKAEAQRVVVFGMHRPPIYEDIRGGFLILGIVVAVLVLVGLGAVWLWQLVRQP